MACCPTSIQTAYCQVSWPFILDRYHKRTTQLASPSGWQPSRTSTTLKVLARGSLAISKSRFWVWNARLDRSRCRKSPPNGLVRPFAFLGPFVGFFLYDIEAANKVLKSFLSTLQPTDGDDGHRLTTVAHRPLFSFLETAHCCKC